MTSWHIVYADELISIVSMDMTFSCSLWRMVTDGVVSNSSESDNKSELTPGFWGKSEQMLISLVFYHNKIFPGCSVTTQSR